MTLARRLVKLERAAGKGERCALCQLMLRTFPPDALRPRLPGRIVSCPRCGTRYTQSPPAEAPEGADVKARVAALYSAFEPDDFYTDRRARAVWLWFMHHPYRAASDALRGERGELEKAQARLRRRTPPPGQKVDRETAQARERRAALVEEAQAALRREEAERRRRLGLRFPDLERLTPRLSARAGYSDPRVEASRLLAFAKLEKVIFGELPAETAAAVAHWRAEWAKAKPEVLRRVRDKMRLEAVNAERRAAGLREFFTVSDMEWQLKREAAEREAAAPAPVSNQPEAGGRVSFRRERSSDSEPGGDGYIEAGAAPYSPDPSEQSSRFGVGAVRPVAGVGLVVIPDVPTIPDPTTGLRLAPYGRIVGPDGEPPETPAPSRRYAPGGSAPARRYRPRT